MLRIMRKHYAHKTLRDGFVIYDTTFTLLRWNMVCAVTVMNLYAGVARNEFENNSQVLLEVRINSSNRL